MESGAGPRIVVATNVAETSITIEGVQLVIDSGQARLLRYDPNRGINTLLVEPISRASADQRAGRAGRTGPGRAIRLWSESAQRDRAPSTLPEVQRLDLAEVVLTLKASGVDDLAAFRWLDPPSATSLTHAEALLVELGALVSRDGRSHSTITDLGRRMLAFPVHPRYARMLVAAQQHGCVRDACLVAALTQGRDLLLPNADASVSEARRELAGPGPASDFRVLMRALDHAVEAGFRIDALRKIGVHGVAAREVRLVFDQFLEIARDQGLDTSQREARFAVLRRCIRAGFSDRVGRRLDGATLRCELVGQRRGTLDKNSVVREPFFVAAEVRELGRRQGEVQTVASLATAIELDWLSELFPGDVDTVDEVWFDTLTRKVRAEQRLRFRKLVMESRPIDVGLDAAARVLTEEVVSGRMTLPLWNHAVSQWILRVNLLAESCPELELPPIRDEDRRSIIEQVCLGATAYRELKNRAVLSVARGWLSPLQQEMVDKFAPERVTLSNGKNPKLLYEEGQPPSVSLRIQELYGVGEVPAIAMGRVGPKANILAPNMRPVQVTTDLAGFWAQHYPEIKPALQRRYPKHEWR